MVQSVNAEQTLRIGEVAELLELETYVLRFWETEFPQLTPLRTPKGQRLYAQRHVELLRTIKKLLHEQGFTIEGARRVLEQGSQPKSADRELVPLVAASPDNADRTNKAQSRHVTSSSALREELVQVRDELLALQKMLRS